jgi:hypothetical protein
MTFKIKSLTKTPFFDVLNPERITSKVKVKLQWWRIGWRPRAPTALLLLTPHPARPEAPSKSPSAPSAQLKNPWRRLFASGNNAPLLQLALHLLAKLGWNKKRSEPGQNGQYWGREKYTTKNLFLRLRYFRSGRQFLWLTLEQNAKSEIFDK